MDFQVVRENALKYLGYQAPMFEGLTPGISSLLGECIEEIKQIAQPKVIVKRFKLAKDPLRLEESGDEILGQQMEDMLEDCEECILIGCTLGIVMERKIKFYAKVNMTKSTVMDAATDMKKHLGLITEHIVHVPDMEIFHLNSTKELLYY